MSEHEFFYTVHNHKQCVYCRDDASDNMEYKFHNFLYKIQHVLLDNGELHSQDYNLVYKSRREAVRCIKNRAAIDEASILNQKYSVVHTRYPDDTFSFLGGSGEQLEKISVVKFIPDSINKHEFCKHCECAKCSGKI